MSKAAFESVPSLRKNWLSLFEIGTPSFNSGHSLLMFPLLFILFPLLLASKQQNLMPCG